MSKQEAKQEAKKETLQEVVADYPVYQDSICLWGVNFKSDGKEEPRYVAKVDAETAKSLIDAKRAK